MKLVTDDMTKKLNMNRLQVAYAWHEHIKIILKLEAWHKETGGSASLLKEKKEYVKYLENKYPFLKEIKAILQDQTPCQIGEYEY